jgi:ribosomal protein S27AE
MTRKPLPLYGIPLRKRCPVCGEVTYSAAGIHSQCAMKQADAKRMQQLKPPSKSPEKKTVKGADVKPWQKICPKCQAIMHVRKKLCDCGYAFPGMGGP